MNVSGNSRWEPGFEGEAFEGGSGAEDTAAVRMALGSLAISAGSGSTGARAGVVNRTHRVVRQRAQVMQARRSHVRGLMAPLVLCSILLILTVVAVWSGLYQPDAVEAVQADVAAALAAATDSDHVMVLLLWFVPVSMTVLGVMLYRRTRGGAERETAR